jgi:hypothetical protein
LQKICLAAGEGVGRAVAFSFALASNAVAGEPEKKEDTFNLPPVVVQDKTGPYVVPGALQPITIDREADEGRYEDPNVWMRHPLGRRARR